MYWCFSQERSGSSEGRTQDRNNVRQREVEGTEKDKKHYAEYDWWRGGGAGPRVLTLQDEDLGIGPPAINVVRAAPCSSLRTVTGVLKSLESSVLPEKLFPLHPVWGTASFNTGHYSVSSSQATVMFQIHCLNYDCVVVVSQHFVTHPAI